MMKPTRMQKDARREALASVALLSLLLSSTRSHSNALDLAIRALALLSEGY